MFALKALGIEMGKEKSGEDSHSSTILTIKHNLNKQTKGVLDDDG